MNSEIPALSGSHAYFSLSVQQFCLFVHAVRADVNVAREASKSETIKVTFKPRVQQGARDCSATCPAD